MADEDIGGVKSNKAKDLGYYLLFFMKNMLCIHFILSFLYVLTHHCSVPFLTEDGLFDLIRKSKPAKAPVDKHQNNNSSEKLQKSQTKSSPAKVEKRGRLELLTSNDSIVG